MGLKEETSAVEILAPAARTTGVTSTTLDMWGQNRARSLKALVSCGAASGTTPTLNVRLQHADNDVPGEFVDVPGGAAAQLTGAGFREVDVTNTKRFVRAVAAIGGTTPSFTFGVIGVFGDALSVPL